MGATGGQDNSASGDATSLRAQPLVRNTICMKTSGKLLSNADTRKRPLLVICIELNAAVTDTPAVQEAVARYVDEQNVL